MNEIIGRQDPRGLFSHFLDFPSLADRTARDWPLAASRNEWLPPVDIREVEGAYQFQIDVPGMKAQDLEVELHEGVLSIRGSRSTESDEASAGVVRIERHSGTFVRQFRVPTSARPEELDAQITDGVLKVTVPKGGETESRKVPIQ